MSTETLERPVEVEIVNPTRMVHLRCKCDDFHGICGSRVQGIWTAESVDCVVCLEVKYCPQCGVRI